MRSLWQPLGRKHNRIDEASIEPCAPLWLGWKSYRYEDATMKLTELKTHDQVLRESLEDPEFRREWDRTALARAVATRLVQYRAKHGLSQSGLARALGMQQPAIARLEAGDHNPSLDTLWRLSQGLKLRFHIDITPESLDLTA
jgi:DNA-binding XRE family transcriptional regulator